MILVDIKHFLFPSVRKIRNYGNPSLIEFPNLLILVVMDSCKS